MSAAGEMDDDAGIGRWRGSDRRIIGEIPAHGRSPLSLYGDEHRIGSTPTGCARPLMIPLSYRGMMGETGIAGEGPVLLRRTGSRVSHLCLTHALPCPPIIWEGWVEKSGSLFFFLSGIAR